MSRDFRRVDKCGDLLTLPVTGTGDRSLGRKRDTNRPTRTNTKIGRLKRIYFILYSYIYYTIGPTIRSFI